MAVIDVALVRNQLSGVPPDRIERSKLVREPLQLGRDLWIGRLDGDLTDQILDACEPPGVNYPLHRAWGVMYALYRTNAPEAPQSRYRWDPDGRLSLAIRMSRLVHATSLAYEFTARVADAANSSEKVIAPSRIKGWGAKAYVLDTQSDWLTTDHVAAIHDLMAAYDHNALPERVKSALFYFEYAALTYFVDLRWVTITTACESLVHIDGEREPGNPSRFARSTQTFISRMSRLTERVLGTSLSSQDLRDMYRQRSALAHGQDFTGLTPEKRRLYGLQENALRAILKKAVLERNFAALFQDDASIQGAFPL